MRTAMRSAAVLLIEIALLAALFSYLASRQQTERAIAPPPAEGRLTADQTTPKLQQREEKLKEIQDAHLKALIAAPGDRSALRRLVRVRRRLAGDDPAMLRNQAATYRQAIATGAEVAGEHYTSTAMAILADASTLAANEIESGRKRTSTVVMETRPPTLARTIGPAAERRAPRVIAQRAPRVGRDIRSIDSLESPRRRIWRQRGMSSPDLDERRGPRYQIQVGPVFSLEHATAVTTFLKQAGYAPRLGKRLEPGVTHFQVISEVIPRSVGETRVTALAELGFGAQKRTVSNDRVQLYFGVFASRSNAAELARRIRATGYWAVVTGGSAAGYVIVLGPHGQQTVDAITGIFMARLRTMSLVKVIPAQ